MATGVHVPAGWGQGWAQATFEANARRVHVISFGASVQEGYNSTNRWELPWVNLVRKAMQDRWGDGGCGYRSVSESPSAALYGPYQITDFGAWSPSLGGLTQAILTPTSGRGISAKRIWGEEVLLWYQPGPAGFGEIYSIIDDDDGFWPQQWLFGRQAYIPVSQLMRLGPDNPRDIALSLVGDGAILNGIEGRNRLGIAVHNFARYSTEASLINVEAYAGAPPDETVGDMIFRRNFYRPDLFLYGDMGINDWVNEVPTATVQANVARAFDLAIGANPDVDIVGQITHPGNVPGWPYGTWPAYYAALLEVYQDYGVAIVDQWERSGFSSAYVTDNNIVDDGVHPTDYGHTWYAEPHIRLLTRGIREGSLPLAS